MNIKIFWLITLWVLRYTFKSFVSLLSYWHSEKNYSLTIDVIFLHN